MSSWPRCSVSKTLMSRSAPDKVIADHHKGGVSAEAGIQAITTVMRNLAGGGPRRVCSQVG